MPSRAKDFKSFVYTISPPQHMIGLQTTGPQTTAIQKAVVRSLLSVVQSLYQTHLKKSRESGTVTIQIFHLFPMSATDHPIEHLAIILDGNRRWAVEHNLPKLIGHTEGAKNLKRVAKAVLAKKIRYLTLYCLSTENLQNRTPEELKHLFSLLEQLTDYLGEFVENNARVNVIGNPAGLPQSTQKKLLEMVENTKHHHDMVMTLAVNYGGRDEITRAVKKIVQENIPAENITEETIQQHLDTADMPDVDLVIRTGGDQRLSNYLPWQSTYAELYFTPTHWPAFSEKNLDEALEWFQNQKRNKGK